MPCIHNNTDDNNNDNNSLSLLSNILSSFDNYLKNKIIRSINKNNNLFKRDMWYSDGGDAGRYAFFAFFVLAIIVFIIMTCVINVKRMKSGRAPVISSYLSPPNYHQSQTAYEGQVVTNLPTYTPAANPNQDVGYYDKNGNFIPANSTINNNNNNNNNNEITTTTNSIELNDNPYQQPYINDNNQNPNQSLNEMSYRRPDQPPPNITYQPPSTSMIVGSSSEENNNENNGNTNEPELPPYIAPEAPPLPDKSHYRS